MIQDTVYKKQTRTWSQTQVQYNYLVIQSRLDGDSESIIYNHSKLIYIEYKYRYQRSPGIFCC